jgi:hypothetical protein
MEESEDPMNIEALREVTTIVCHRHSSERACPDGIASAILLHDVLPSARFVFASHGRDVDSLDVAPGMLFCDVTPSERRAREFADAGAIVLDHHVTAQGVIEVFGDRGVFAEHAHQSGATLAYLHAWVPLSEGTHRDNPIQRRQNAALFATLAATRDTFDKEHPQWLAACEQAEALTFYEWEDFAAIGDPFGDGLARLGEMFKLGRRLYAGRRQRAAAALAGAVRAQTTRGTRLAIVNTLDTSDVGDLLASGDALAEVRAEPEAVVVGFHYFGHDGGAAVRYSLRSGRYDVGSLCKAYGGGGHRLAAGFMLDVGTGDPIERVLALFDGHEAGL